MKPVRSYNNGHQQIISSSHCWWVLWSAWKQCLCYIIFLHRLSRYTVMWYHKSCKWRCAEASRKFTWKAYNLTNCNFAGVSNAWIGSFNRRQSRLMGCGNGTEAVASLDCVGIGTSCTRLIKSLMKLHLKLQIFVPEGHEVLRFQHGLNLPWSIQSSLRGDLPESEEIATV